MMMHAFSACLWWLGRLVSSNQGTSEIAKKDAHGSWYFRCASKFVDCKCKQMQSIKVPTLVIDDDSSRGELMGG